MAVEDFTNSKRPLSDGARGPLAGLPAEDREIALTVATLLLDIIDVFGKEVTVFAYEQVQNLPRDAEAVSALETHAEANALEVLTSLRAELPADAFETPAEAIAHARYLRRRGVGFTSLVQIYRHGFAVFREVIIAEIQARAGDPGQVQRVTHAFDTYGFPFVSTALQRLAYEFGVTDQGWSPSKQDEEMGAQASRAAAQQMREKAISESRWVAATVPQSRAQARAQSVIDDFIQTFEDGVRKYGLGQRLALAHTSVTLTLADDPGESVSLLLDRAPVEAVDGEAGTDAQLWIASTDLKRLWSPDFYLPMAIAKGRVRTAGPARSFLRVLPIIRSVGGQIPDRYNPNTQSE